MEKDEWEWLCLSWWHYEENWPTCLYEWTAVKDVGAYVVCDWVVIEYYKGAIIFFGIGGSWISEKYPGNIFAMPLSARRNFYDPLSRS